MPEVPTLNERKVCQAVSPFNVVCDDWPLRATAQKKVVARLNTEGRSGRIMKSPPDMKQLRGLAGQGANPLWST